MTPRWREALLPLALVAAAAAGLALDAFAGNAPAQPKRSLPADRITARAIYCPPTVRGGSTALFVGTASEAEASVRIEPVAEQQTLLAPDGFLARTLERPHPTDVVGYGAPVTGAAVTVFGNGGGTGAALCAGSASSDWFFAEGSSLLGFDQRILVYNPFLDEAVVRVTLFTPSGVRSKAGLNDIPVPARSATTIAINDFIFQQRLLGARVEAVRGRIVAWRALNARPKDRPRGVELSLGAAAPSATWYFPAGGVGRGLNERISILNPGDEEATITISLATPEDVIQPPKLVEVPVAAGTATTFSLAEATPRGAGDLGGVSAIVASSNGVEVVAERLQTFDSANLEGFASEVGATATHPAWWLPPATARPKTDVVALMNPGSNDARVSIVLLRARGEPLAPGRLAGIALKAGSRLEIPVNAWTAGRPMAAILTADTPVVAERWSYSAAGGDVASVMGVPVNRAPAP